jgi:hypothetical protein
VKRDALPIDETTALLRELVAEVRGLRADMAAANRAHYGIDEPLVNLLHEIYGFAGTERFSAASLIEQADATLLAALNGMDALTLGRTLPRLKDLNVDGLRLVLVGRGVDGNEWRIQTA